MSTQLDDVNWFNNKMEEKYNSYEKIASSLFGQFHHSCVIFMVAHFTLIIDHQLPKFLMELDSLTIKLTK
jgi:hypothetical protein